MEPWRGCCGCCEIGDATFLVAVAFFVKVTPYQHSAPRFILLFRYTSLHISTRYYTDIYLHISVITAASPMSVVVTLSLVSALCISNYQSKLQETPSVPRP
ncbi:hypothetical protein P152DRAFT_187589 [Eremomyces bilateralis CBS 781.70]|uniref:Uncharacterized protein n=1 Tax=Eremomyces bilateralis CBS 781.70 TaxID=1392243 RepID=A0A6G1GC60_9PEZI|nr:uncharacterized protein P152DRAFT_187589 [Eremomyces bilateralis CBS 781.70]KAF1815516.1 hypothetical protein P152DRAFT_187589 [Eremomyces bilateralis CBS 781.70]